MDHWRLGRERFGRKLGFELDAGTTADEVLADAEAEFTRVTKLAPRNLLLVGGP